MKQYKLLGADGQTYLSDEPGTLGGNRKLKIYGRLDCSSANYWVKHGNYAEECRVFFKDEATAAAAGYRPCGRCMRERYKEWLAATEAGREWRPE